ncbi:MAG: hypothetical protein FJW39_14180 [Acidobacteria bacterium]|nr:hypothetical protein [Acidobacteriota bacterium]
MSTSGSSSSPPIPSAISRRSRKSRLVPDSLANRPMHPALLLAALSAATPAEIVYAEPAPGVRLTMSYSPAAGPGPHPAAVVIDESYCTGFLSPAGYAVFTINPRPTRAAEWRESATAVQRAVRYVRQHARRWNVDSNRIALIGGASGGLLSNLAGVLDSAPHRKSSDPVDRQSAEAQAVVTFSGPSDFRGLFREDTALAEASPVLHIRRDAPPFLLIHGDRDETVPLVQSAHWQSALQAAGVHCDLIIISGGAHGTAAWHTIPGVRDWELEMIHWLNTVLGHRGPAGAGIRLRTR